MSKDTFIQLTTISSCNVLMLTHDGYYRQNDGLAMDGKLAEINQLHPKLQFTIEREKENMIPFLDMKIMRAEGKLTLTWYCKSTDTGLIMNFHALAPIKYKRSVVSGMVHRIFQACSTWKNFHHSFGKEYVREKPIHSVIFQPNYQTDTEENSDPEINRCGRRER